jgi:hypothetical protein
LYIFLDTIVYILILGRLFGSCKQAYSLAVLYMLEHVMFTLSQVSARKEVISAYGVIAGGGSVENITLS